MLLAVNQLKGEEKSYGSTIIKRQSSKTERAQRHNAIDSTWHWLGREQVNPFHKEEEL